MVRTRTYRSFLFACLLFSAQPGLGEKVFDFNSTCRQAYSEIRHLKLNAGQQLINQEKKRNPDNLIPYFLENYIDFFILFYTEDPAEYKKRINNLDDRLELINQGPSNSPFYLFSKSVIHFQWAAVKIKFSKTWDAGWEFRRSYLQIKDNLKKFPSFSPNLIFNGSMQVTVGTIPDGYKWLTNLFGMRGDMKAGIKQIEDFLAKTDEWANLFHEECIFYYLYLKFYVQNDHKGVFEFIEKNKMDLKDNHLFAFLAANLRLNGQQAAETEKIILSRNPSSEYFFLPIWDLELGYAKLNRLDTSAVVHFEKFLKEFKGKFYVKDAYQKISWYYYIQGDQTKANYFRKEILNHGNLETEADQQAQKEAKTDRWPEKILLQARLLNDGGYYMEALRILYGKKHTDFPRVEDKLEFTYRVGRLYDDLERDDEAIEFYKQAIYFGEKRKEHFASRAALQIGFIYEKRNDFQTAISWFNRCIGMKDHEFKNSLDQRAKAGIARCEASAGSSGTE